MWSEGFVPCSPPLLRSCVILGKFCIYIFNPDNISEAQTPILDYVFARFSWVTQPSQTQFPKLNSNSVCLAFPSSSLLNNQHLQFTLLLNSEMWTHSGSLSSSQLIMSKSLKCAFSSNSTWSPFNDDISFCITKRRGFTILKSEKSQLIKKPLMSHSLESTFLLF